jgi:hypothetical protein
MRFLPDKQIGGELMMFAIPTLGRILTSDF